MSRSKRSHQPERAPGETLPSHTPTMTTVITQTQPLDDSDFIIKGQLVDTYTRCIHYHSQLDIIALRFKCCPNTFYPCFKCHDELKIDKFHVRDQYKVVICGDCLGQLTANEYLNSGSVCPRCQAEFNPGCSLHYKLYFDF